MAGLQEIETLVREIKAGKAAPIYLFYGDQDYLVKQAYDRALEALVPEELRAFNLEQMDGQRCEPAQVLEAVNTLPMMPGPKAVGVPECRFFLSRSSAADLLAKARERWEQKDPAASLRQLGKVLALAELDFTGAEGFDLERLGLALGSSLDEDKLGGEWLAQALAQGLASDFPMPKGADDSQDLLDGLEAGAPPAGVHLVLAAPSADSRKRLFKLVEGRGKVLDFKGAERGKGGDAAAGVFIRSLLAQRGLSMDVETGRRALAAYGHDLGLLAREIDKLAAHAHPRTALGQEDLEAVGSPRPEEEVWALLRALGDGERKAAEALAVLGRQLERQPPERLFAMLSSELRSLYQCRCMAEEGLVSLKGLGNYGDFKARALPALLEALPPGLAEGVRHKNPYAFYQGLVRCREFSLERLSGCLVFLFEAEKAMKTGSRECAGLLEELVLKICGVRDEALL
jgi:DNA polymerase-3 subunit delta